MDKVDADLHVWLILFFKLECLVADYCTLLVKVAMDIYFLKSGLEALHQRRDAFVPNVCAKLEPDHLQS
jgi:hypothetical protein